jgi:hypothetical protein
VRCYRFFTGWRSGRLRCASSTPGHKHVQRLHDTLAAAPSMAIRTMRSFFAHATWLSRSQPRILRLQGPSGVLRDHRYPPQRAGEPARTGADGPCADVSRGETKIDQIAGQIGVSSRTLSRRLADLAQAMAISWIIYAGTWLYVMCAQMTLHWPKPHSCLAIPRSAPSITRSSAGRGRPRRPSGRDERGQFRNWRGMAH